jgi:hypothetical protein
MTCENERYDDREFTAAEQSLLSVCGFVWNEAHGVLLDDDGNSWDADAAIEECHAMADLAAIHA